MKNRVMRVFAIILIAVTCFSLVAYAAVESYTSELTATMRYAQTQRANSATGEAKLYGFTTNNKSANFAIIKFTSQTMSTTVAQWSNLQSASSVYTNYGGLAYAGYMQSSTASLGAIGRVTIYAR